MRLKVGSGLNLAAMPWHLLDRLQEGVSLVQRTMDRQQSIGRPFQIRVAEPKDAEAISECLVLAFAQFRGQYTPGAYADTVLNSEGVLQRLAQMGMFVAVSDGSVIGTIAYKANGVEGHLRGMAVLQEWRGTGVASALLNAAEVELRESRCAVITLDTTEPLIRAIEFYKRHGFIASGRVTDFFGMPLYEYTKGLH
jgi:GNAT superfamily N-acetyltransferase